MNEELEEFHLDSFELELGTRDGKREKGQVDSGTRPDLGHLQRIKSLCLPFRNTANFFC